MEFCRFKQYEAPEDIASTNAYPNYIVTFLPDRYTIGNMTMRKEELYKRPNILKTTYLSQIDIDNRLTIDFAYSEKDTTEILANDKRYWWDRANIAQTQ